MTRPTQHSAPAPVAGGLEWVDAAPLADGGRVRHAFFTRRGGCSEGIYAALNCGLGSNDDRERVRTNRALAMHALGLPADALATTTQVHSATALAVTGPWPDGRRPAADGLATNRPGVALGILTADCAPVLFADAEAGVIGAAHAGWRGAKDGILEATLRAMADLGGRAQATEAAVGPAIGQASYEVAADFRQQFVADEPATTVLFQPSARPGRWRFDLAGYVVRRLSLAGVRRVTVLPLDTCADEDRFFSFRRVTLAGGGDYGRQLSAIALVDG
jgi:YfiH family protein